MSLKLVIVILCIVILCLLFFLWFYQRQIQKICQQLTFQRRQQSNICITSEVDLGGLKELTNILNQQIEDQREERVRYRRKEALISDTYTSLSHDIRTPLTSLDGYVQLLADSKEEKEQEHYLQVIQERIDRLKDMLEELFLFTKLGSDSYQIELYSCDWNHVIKDTIFSYYDDWKQKGIEPKIVLPEGSVVILGNEQALHRTLQNVLKNAVEHGDHSLWIRMQEWEQKGKQMVSLEVGNEMVSGSDLDVERVFERFYCADQMRSANSTGLGLPIAKELVLRMQGSIEAAVQEKEFVIRMTFPVLEGGNSDLLQKR